MRLRSVIATLSGTMPPPLRPLRPPSPAAIAATLDADRAALAALLARHGGALARVAAELGWARSTLYRRLDALGMRDVADAYPRAGRGEAGRQKGAKTRASRKSTGG